MMAVFPIGALVLLLVALWIIFRRRSALRANTSELLESEFQEPSEEYLALRNMVFESARAHLQLPTDFKANEPWAVVMDWRIGEGVATIVAVQDGSASIYFSTGGGSVGGGQSHESIRVASQNALSIAAKHLGLLLPVRNFPYCTHFGQVYFYILTDSGIYFAESNQKK